MISRPMPALLLLFALLLPLAAHGESRTHDVILESDSGESIVIGSVTFSADGDGDQFRFTMDDSKFSDQFLSMRPFKCLDGDTMVCHLAYPYERMMKIQTGDLADLEYEFLFIARSPTEYGIDPYNGRYFVLENTDDGYVGTVHAVDLNILAAPPEVGNLRPITPADLDLLEPESERFPRLRIR